MIDKTTEANGSRKGKVLGVLAVSVSAVVIGVGLYFLHKKIESMPQKITELYGVYIGDSEADVLIKNGKPRWDSAISSENGVLTKSIHYNNSSYESVSGSYISINLEGLSEDSLSVVEICSHKGTGGAIYILNVNGIELGESMDSLIDHLGEPSSKDIRSDKLAAMYSYSQYNLRFIVKSGAVTDPAQY